MTLIRAIFAIALFLPLQTATQSLEGVVVDRVTSAAIAGVNVELTGIAGDRTVSYNAKSDAQGKFAFRNVAVSAGYWLIATHEDAHLQTVYGQRGLVGTGTQIQVSAGQQMRDVRLAMIPTGELSGRITNNEGKPLGDAQILAMTIAFRDGVRIWSAPKSFVRTNGRGEYRITGLPPGAYTVRILPNNTLNERAPFFRDMLGDDASASTLPTTSRLFDSEGYPAVYYPGVSAESRAKTVDLRAGGRVTGVDVSLTKMRTRRIRGSVIDEATKQPIGPADILLIRRGAHAGRLPSLVVHSMNGRFDERGIVPGAYFVVITAGDPRAPLRGRASLEIQDADLDNLEVIVGRGHNLTGQVTIEGNVADRAGVSAIQVILKPNPPSEPGLGPPPTLLASNVSGNDATFEAGFLPRVEIPAIRSAVSNGALAFRGVHAWEYTVIVDNLPEDVYVKSVWMGTVDVLANGLRVDGPPPDSLQVVLSGGAGRISGRVQDRMQKPASAVRVVLAPESSQHGRGDLYQALLTDQDGQFEIRNIAPGNYKIFAFEHVSKDLWLDDNFLHLYESEGKPVRVDQGDRLSVDLQSLPPWY